MVNLTNTLILPFSEFLKFFTLLMDLECCFEYNFQNNNHLHLIIFIVLNFIKNLTHYYCFHDIINNCEDDCYRMTLRNQLQSSIIYPFIIIIFLNKKNLLKLNKSPYIYVITLKIFFIGNLSGNLKKLNNHFLLKICNMIKIH